MNGCEQASASIRIILVLTGVVHMPVWDYVSHWEIIVIVVGRIDLECVC